MLFHDEIKIMLNDWIEMASQTQMQKVNTINRNIQMFGQTIWLFDFAGDRVTFCCSLFAFIFAYLFFFNSFFNSKVLI